MSNLVTLSQVQDVGNAIIGKVAAKNYLESANLPSYTIKKQQTAETGYSATYQLFEVLGEGASATETAVGAKINIIKDQFVSGGDVKTVTTADVPYEGAQVGDKYIDLVLANSEGTHVYLPVNELVDAYTGGDGIAVSAQNEITVDLDSTANGLIITNAGKLKLDVATASTSGVGGSAGAMSAADKEKLDNADVTAYTAGNGINVTSHEISAVVDQTNANGLSVGANGIALAAATTSGAGAMSAADKTKLDAADVTAYTAGNGVDVTNHVVSAVVDGSNANGLSVGANGIALAAATTSGAGAMSAADKTKLDDITIATTAEVNAVIAALDNL